jgi:hypothetical protein
MIESRIDRHAEGRGHVKTNGAEIERRVRDRPAQSFGEMRQALPPHAKR